MSRCFVISGPSGVGKGTLCQKLMAEHAQQLGLVLSVSMTTRAPRTGEINGQHYYFVRRAQFEQQIWEGELLEWAEYNGQYYGTPKTPVAAQLAAGKSVLLEIEPQGAFQVRQHFPKQSCLIFIAPSSMDVLKERLLGRGTNTVDDIGRRLRIAQAELAQQHQFDVTIINNQLEQALVELVQVIKQQSNSR